MKPVLVVAHIGMPVRLEVIEGPEEPGGLPQRLGRAAQVPQITHTVVRLGNKCAVLTKWVGGPARLATDVQNSCDGELLLLRLSADSLAGALLAAQPVLEAAIDHLAFQLQRTIPVLSLQATDVTPPLRSGDDREALIYTEPNAVLAPKFSTIGADFRWTELTTASPDIGSLPDLDEKQRMALWWYVKSLATEVNVDRFLALWTALEILWDRNGPRITGPARCRSGHLLEKCPTCDVSLEREVRGKSIQAYLIHRGVSEGDAQRLWDFRQVVHGKTSSLLAN